MGAVSLAARPRTDWTRSPPGVVLLGLLALVLLTAVACPRDPDRLASAERTTLQASQSLRLDGDLVFAEADLERLQSWSWSADDLDLAPTRDGGRRFDTVAVYPLLLAPITGLAPLRGPAVVNALLLVLTVWAATTTLARRSGRSAAALVGTCVFASVLYRSVFLFSPVMLMAAGVALAMRLALRHEEPGAHGLREIYRPQESGLVSTLRAIVVGGLVGLVAAHHPILLLLLAPVLTAIPRQQRRSGAVGSVVGAVLVLATVWLTSGLWGQPVAGGTASLGEVISPATVGLAAWNALYFAIGRNVGLLPYFLPFVALLGLWKGGSGRSVLVVTALVGSLAPLILSPFNFFSGPVAVGNAWLVPWFVLLWFVPTEPLPRGWLPATLLLAIPVMYPTWLATEIEPVTATGITRQSAGRWHRHLPPETTQRALPPGEVMGNRFWIRSLNREARVSGASRWLLSGKGWVELHLAAPEELAALHLQFGPQAAAELEVEGAELGDMILLPDGGVGFRLERPRRRGLHPMWWSDERYHNYVVRFRMPMPEARSQTLSITAIAANLERAR